jgi:hypothetical protein
MAGVVPMEVSAMVTALFKDAIFRELRLSVVILQNASHSKGQAITQDGQCTAHRPNQSRDEQVNIMGRICR